MVDAKESILKFRIANRENARMLHLHYRVMESVTNFNLDVSQQGLDALPIYHNARIIQEPIQLAKNI